MSNFLDLNPLTIRARPEARPTVAQALKSFCLECVGATSRRGAFDCLSGICPLYACMPFRGKAMPKTLQPKRGISEEEQRRQGEYNRRPRKRPSRRLIAAYCRHCQPGDRTDCLGINCAFYPFRPWEGPGKAPRRKLSEMHRTRLVAATAPYRFKMHASNKPSTAVGAAPDA